MFAGVVYGLLACMLWGLVYLVPLVLPNYDPVYIAAGRFVGFGIIAAPLVCAEYKEFRHYKLSDWLFVSKLGIFGNIVYYWCLINCIQNAGAPLAGMCMAVIPVLVAVVSNLRNRRNGAHIPWRRLAPGLVLISVGLLVANVTEFELVIEAGQNGAGRFWYGVLMGIFALLIWTWYPIQNADWLLDHPRRSPRSWSTAQGLTTLPFAIVLYLALWVQDAPGTPLLGPDPAWFILVAAGSGILCSWLGIVFWNAMSQRLPTALGGQMIVFETIFAVIYAHLLRGAWPSWNMILGMALLIAGVLFSLRAFHTQKSEQNVMDGQPESQKN